MLDARSAFLFRRGFDPYFSTDGIHPSPEGHRALSEYLLPQLERLLGRQGAGAERRELNTMAKGRARALPFLRPRVKPSRRLWGS